tara:strand:+ start:310 stop:879 length:570 start_codon:yes stop_codon:yes gene_type:complete
MYKEHLDCCYSISKFTQHKQVKHSLLDIISKSEFTSPQFFETEVDISRCDWHLATSFNREWVLHIKDFLFDDMLEIYKNLGYDGFTLQEIWFQQYLTGSEHGWHTHSSNFTNVYYLELPETASKTQIIVPWDQKTVIEIDVKEGDILSFPSFVIHKGPKNLSSEKKTIVSYNTNLTFSDNLYNTYLGDS